MGFKEVIYKAFSSLQGEEPNEETLKREHELRKLKIERGLAFNWNDFFKYSSIFLLGAIFLGIVLLLGGLKYGSPLLSSTITTPMAGNIDYLIDFETDVDFQGYFAKDKFKMLEKKYLNCTELFDYKIIEHGVVSPATGFFTLDSSIEYQKLLDEGWVVFETQEYTELSNTSAVRKIALRKSKGNCEYVTVERETGSPKFIPTNLTIKNLKIKTSGGIGLNTTFSSLVEEFVKRYIEEFKGKLENV